MCVSSEVKVKVGLARLGIDSVAKRYISSVRFVFWRLLSLEEAWSVDKQVK